MKVRASIQLDHPIAVGSVNGSPADVLLQPGKSCECRGTIAASTSGKAALDGKYAEALQLLDTAIAKRPNYEALMQDRQITAKASNLMNQLDKAAVSLKTGKLSAGDKTIQAVTKELKEREEPVLPRYEPH